MRALPLLLATAALALALPACGADNGGGPFGDPNASAPTAPERGPGTDAPTTPQPSTPAPPLDPLPSTPADAPSPAGTTPTKLPPGSKPGDLTPEQAIAADRTAMLNARTVVSVIEGCHSGSESYRDCNSHEELGDPGTLGLELGKKTGQVQISATDRGFRVTARSESGAKFTVARGPRGDRFKCLAGPVAGACGKDRSWKW